MQSCKLPHAAADMPLHPSAAPGLLTLSSISFTQLIDASYHHHRSASETTTFFPPSQSPSPSRKSSPRKEGVREMHQD